MKKFSIICLILCILIPQFVHAEAIDNTADLQTTVSTVNSSQGIDAQTAMLGVGQIVKNIRAAFLYEANSGTLMYAYDADAQMYPASFVKIMTALIAIEKGNMDDLITVTDSAIKAVPGDAVSAKLLEGETITLKDLVYCLLVGSANDAAAVIAEHISGSQEAFVDTMNQRAQQIGCTATSFTNPHGLHNDAQYTTARDAARILNEALANETFFEIFTTRKHIVPDTNLSLSRELISGNSMMDTGSAQYYDSRVIGGRTGVTNDGRRCFIAVSENNGMRLISVVMGSESEFLEDGYSVVTIGGFNETKALLDAGFNGYKTAQILSAGQVLKQCTVTDGINDVYLGSEISVSTVLPDNVDTSGLAYRYTTDSFSAPITAGEKLTDLEIWYGTMCVAKAELFAMNSVEKRGTYTVLDTPDSTTEIHPAIIVVALILIAALLVFLLWKGWKRIRRLIASVRSKRYRRNRRRSR